MWAAIRQRVPFGGPGEITVAEIQIFAAETSWVRTPPVGARQCARTDVQGIYLYRSRAKPPREAPSRSNRVLLRWSTARSCTRNAVVGCRGNQFSITRRTSAAKGFPIAEKPCLRHHHGFDEFLQFVVGTADFPPVLFTRSDLPRPPCAAGPPSR